MSAEVIKCQQCGKPLNSKKMEVEYSEFLCEFYCSYDCAMNRFFNYMECTQIDLSLPLPESAQVNPAGFLVKGQGAL